MPLRVLYVEDRDPEYKLLQKAIDTANENEPDWKKIILSRANHPLQLPDALGEYPDVVLADVYFPLKKTLSDPDGPDSPQLEEIIRQVKEWDSKGLHGFPTPVIAYTGKGRPTLEGCLRLRDDLYDIWDKMSADANYVAWRLQRVASELPRYRPDATMQKLILALPAASCPSWHNHVLNLIKSYGEGKTEFEQMHNCRDHIQSILAIVHKKHAVQLMTLWDALTGSEPLLRASSQKIRGIGRHSINVFWFGYWLINHKDLKDHICKLWSAMLDERKVAVDIKTVSPMEGINAVWILASLFHDSENFMNMVKI